MVSPAQARVEQTKSEAKQLRETTQGKAPQSSTKRPRGQNSVKPKKKKKNTMVQCFRMESFNSEMMLFQPPVVNHGIEYLQWIECRPVNQITGDGSIDIHLKASGSQYLDLQRSR